MLRKLRGVGNHRGGACDKQHLKASYHIIRDQYHRDLGRFAFQVFPESLVLRLQGTLLAYSFF